MIKNHEITVKTGFVLLIALNIYIFVINFLNYTSALGTDFTFYGPYIEFFTFSQNTELQEQGVGYFWLISKFIELNINPIFISPIYKSLLIEFGIQSVNFIMYLIGMIGIFQLLKYFKIEIFQSIIILCFLTIFPPLVGARLILKPEILAFALMPWALILLFKYSKNQESKYLFLLSPVAAILLTLKASITLMTFILFTLFIDFKKWNKAILLTSLFTLLSMLLILNESQQISGLYLWEHKSNPSYLFKAPLSFFFSLNTDLFINPFRDSQATSMWGILFLDTFGDYWERYWLNLNAWKGNKYWCDCIVPGNINNLRVGMIFSLVFYIGLLISLIKEKSKDLKKFGITAFIGIIVLMVNAGNFLPFLTMNFNPSKGDPIKTHYFIFFLVFSFTYLLIKLFNKRSSVFSLSIFLLFFIFTFQLFNPIENSYFKSDSQTINKIHLFSPCVFGDPLGSVFNYTDSWCSQEEIANSICINSQNESIDIKTNKFISLQKNNIITTPQSESECIELILQNFANEESVKLFSTNDPKSPYVFFVFFIFSMISIIYFLIDNKRVKND